jgi:hypothetical protein
MSQRGSHIDRPHWRNRTTSLGRGYCAKQRVIDESSADAETPVPAELRVGAVAAVLTLSVTLLVYDACIVRGETSGGDAERLVCRMQFEVCDRVVATIRLEHRGFLTASVSGELAIPR